MSRREAFLDRLSMIRWRALLLALAPAILIIWLATGRLDNNPASDSQSADLLPSDQRYDAYGSEIQSLVYDDNGYLLYSISAAEQRSYPDQHTDLTLPIIRMYENGAQRWNISAASGRIQTSSGGGDIERFDLQDSVQILHRNTTDTSTPTGNITLSTDWLVVEPLLERLYTDAPVTVRGPQIEQQAVGLRADFSLQSLDFLADVQGRFVRTAP